MKQKQSSTTAEGMAIVRAIESSRPADRRLFFDPIARRLVSPISVALSRWTIDSGLYNRIGGPGVIEFITARERYIDDFLTAAIREGLPQLVLLGAGFDTRPYRIPGIEKTRVFELDHPATQAEKRKRIQKVVRPLPGNITFVPIDFNTQDLGQRLAESGYDERAKTLFIWQGVVMYLEPEAVDATLAFIAGHSAPGSAVIFDYFYTETLQDMRMARTKKITSALGESLRFGVGRAEAGPFLESRGFTGVHNADAAELKRLYFAGTDRVVKEGAAIVSAVVR